MAIFFAGTKRLPQICPPLILLFILGLTLAPCSEPTFQPDAHANTASIHPQTAHGHATEGSHHGEHSHQHQDDGSHDAENHSCHCAGIAVAGELDSSSRIEPCLSAGIMTAHAGIASPRPVSAPGSRYCPGLDAIGSPLYLTNNTFLI